MPTLFVLNGWKIQMFVDENEVPHFHVWKAGKQYRFRLSDFEQMRSDTFAAPRSLSREVRAWAERNREALAAAHTSLVNGQIPNRKLFRN